MILLETLYKQLTVAQLWAAISTVLLSLLLFSKFFKDVFGIEAFGRKVYKGFPLMMKWIWRDAAFRKEMSAKMDLVVQELKHNGGSSVKDVVKKIELEQKRQAGEIQSLKGFVDMCNIRADIADISNERMTFRINADGACTYINDIFLRKFGYSERDVLGFGFENIVHEDDVQEMREKWQRAIAQKGRFYDEQRIWDVQRNVHLCVVRGYPRTEDNKLLEFLGTIEFFKQ